MSTAEKEVGLDQLENAIAALQRSSRRTIPLFLIGFAATLIAAAIAIYYIIALSTNLREAKAALRESDTALAAARLNLAAAQASLRQSQQAATAPGNAERIAAAISNVSRSQSDLKVASSSIRQATAKLPTQTADKVTDLSGLWTDQYGTTYDVRHDGVSFSYRAAFRNPEQLGAAARGEARGTARNNNLSYRYADESGNKYACKAVASPDRQRIDETCRTPSGGVLRVALVRS